MASPSTRVLQLLALLQARREWSGAELCERLDVDVRTVRRDVARLRELGYVVHASVGPGGGYRLGAGRATPPLLLTDDEAIAVAVALGAGAASVSGLEDVALRVLAKLDQLLPTRLRRRLGALHAVTLTLGASPASVDARLLAELASACRDELRLGFHYRDGNDHPSKREVEPMRLAHAEARWYLVAWDLGREDWRTFRIDRIDRERSVTRGAAFVPRKPPVDFAELVARATRSQPRHTARLTVREPAPSVARRLPHWIGRVEALDGARSLITVSGTSPSAVAALSALVGLDFELEATDEVREALRALAERCARAARPRQRGRTAPTR